MEEVVGMFKDLKNYKFRFQGSRFDSEEERIRFIVNKLHSLSWKHKKDRDVQDGYKYEGYDWNGKYHKEYYELAKGILEIGSFECIATVLHVIDELV